MFKIKKMSNKIYQPVFLNAHIAFTVDQHMMNFTDKNITPYGAHSLPWTPLSPTKHFGRKTIANLRILTKEPVNIQTPARITREFSFSGEQMGLRFDMKPEDRALIQKVIEAEGHYPTDYSRKYPRIPASPEIPSFPLKVLVHPEGSGEGSVPLIFEVGNISLGGILIRSENPFVSSVQLGQNLQLYLEPRGDLPLQVMMLGQVCRILEEMHPTNGNILRMFGVKFHSFTPDNAKSFKELLRDILERIKIQPQNDGKK